MDSSLITAIYVYSVEITNDICRQRRNRSIFIADNAYFKLLHLFKVSSIFELWRHQQFFLNDNPYFFLLFLIDLPTT
jgi:hypothetical protein